jgi:ribose-phosphate pyrophosphokinase
VITIHLHSDQTQGFFDCPIDNIKPRKLFTSYFAEKNIENLVVVSPDAGGAKTAKKFADDLGCSLAIMHKQRPDHHVAEVTHVIGEVAGKTPIIVDDMVDTAGSVLPTKEALIKAGAKDEVYLCFTHAIFSGPATERLNAGGFAEIVCSDSLPIDNPPENLTQLSIAPLIGDIIKRVAKRESVSGLHSS